MNIKKAIKINNDIIIPDPVIKFYIKTTKKLIADSDYYVSFYINDVIISFTNKFTKVVKNNIELYELDLFFYHEKMISGYIPLEYLPLNYILDDYHSISFLGFNYPITKDIDVFTEIYYEIPASYSTKNAITEFIIAYHESQLASDIRKLHSNSCDLYSNYFRCQVDNVLRFMLGKLTIINSQGRTFFDIIYSMANFKNIKNIDDFTQVSKNGLEKYL